MVADKDDASRLMVRARRKADLMNIFGSDVEIVETPEADYRWRLFIARDQFKTLINARIDSIDYTNFKNSVRNDDLHDLYSEFWGLHRNYGKRADRSSRFAWGPGDLQHH